MVTPSVAFFTHPKTYNGLVINGDITYRTYGKKFFFKEVSLGAGYFTKFNYGDTWQVNDNGSVTNTGTRAVGYFAPSASIALGQRFTLKNETPLSVFTKFSSTVLMGYNATAVMEISLELGVRMDLNWGIRTGAVKTKKKQS